MKTNRIIFLLIAFSLSLFGCSDDDTLGKTPELGVGERTLSFDEVTTQTLAIEANGHWTAELIRDTGEFIVTPTEGVGNGEVTITLNRSKAEAIRGYLKVTYTDGKDQGLEVAKSVKLVANKLNTEVLPRSGMIGGLCKSQEIQVNIPGKWQATLSDDTWFTLDKSEGEGKDVIHVLAKEKVSTGRAIDTGEPVELVIFDKDMPRVKYTVTLTRQQSGYEYGKYRTLQRASRGKGINIVLVCTFFLEEDLLPGGRLEQACEIIAQQLFALEPYASHRNFFNLYAVPYPNEYGVDLFGKQADRHTYETPIGTYHGMESTSIGGSDMFMVNKTQLEAVYRYAYDNTPVFNEGKLQEMLVMSVVCSDDRAFGVKAQANSVDRNPNCGIAHACLPAFGGNMVSMMGHELMGHGFGKFHENYYSIDETWPEKEYESFREQQRKFQIYLDVELTDNPDEFVNRAWAELRKMRYRNVRIEEGAITYNHGAWRSSLINVMGKDAGNYPNSGVKDNNYYSPVQRELIMRYIYELAGMKDHYSLQTFLDYDVINEELDRLHTPDPEYYPDTAPFE